MTREGLALILERFAGKRLLVLGDVMLDWFVYGNIERISPEAPVPVLLATREVAMLGGAANVARNIASLGGKAILMGAVGDDKAGAQLRDLASTQSGVDAELLMCVGRPTTVKTRFIADSQQIIRVDQETRMALGADRDALIDLYVEHLASCDAVILSDYAKGVLCDDVVRRSIELARNAGKPIIVDPKSADIARYDGATLITPNLGEAALASGLSGRDDVAVVAMAQALLSRAPTVKGLVVTRSADGMTLAMRGEAAQHFSVKAKAVYDVSGAGDTVIAALSLAVAAGATYEQAVHLANAAAGIVVGKLGTAEVWAQELHEVVQGDQIGAMTSKNAGASQAAAIVASWKAQGLKVGFTNGCFDLIHPGHISLLTQARNACDRLVVGLNTDSSIKRIKGSARPLQGEEARSIVLDAMSVVDLVVLFAEDTPLELICQLKPDVLVKGADYTVDQVVGADLVQSWGGRVVLAQLTAGQSTTNIVSRMKMRA